jgi:predicted TPR repeat methyltransferase
VLELGCGSGKNTEWLITKADKLVGLDYIQSAEKAGFTLLEKKD